jgi:hypothetical protein
MLTDTILLGVDQPTTVAEEVHMAQVPLVLVVAAVLAMVLHPVLEVTQPQIPVVVVAVERPLAAQVDRA